MDPSGRLREYIYGKAAQFFMVIDETIGNFGWGGVFKEDLSISDN
jgi:hypothetical protein